jgi:hypothetical protein
MEPVTVLSPDAFQPHVGEAFELVGAQGQRVTVLLQRLADRGGSPHSTMYSLYFLVPKDGPRDQGLFRLEREGFGSVELLLVPVAQEGESILFEAAVNLLKANGE